eukprot:tig00000615_g2582.t1
MCRLPPAARAGAAAVRARSERRAGGGVRSIEARRFVVGTPVREARVAPPLPAPRAAEASNVGWMLLGVAFEVFMRCKGRFPGASVTAASTLMLSESCFALSAPAALAPRRAALGAAAVLVAALSEAWRRCLVSSTIATLYRASPRLSLIYRVAWFMLYAFVCCAAAARARQRPAPAGSAGSRRNPASVIRELEASGATVYPPAPAAAGGYDWGDFRGYGAVKAAVEESLVSVIEQHALARKVAAATRNQVGGTAVPRAVLFHGKPGVGKTLCARQMAKKCSAHLVYISGEMFLSKYYGDSERRLARIFRLARSLGDKVFLFVDEIESLLVDRRRGGTDGDGATNGRLLSIFLRQLDGFDSAQSDCSLTLVAATNRRQDLDEALTSRFEVTIEFGLPDEGDRVQILQEYARHLSLEDLAALSIAADGLSARNIRDACIRAERRLLYEVARGSLAGGRARPSATLAVWSPDGVPLPSLATYEWALAEVRTKEEAGRPSPPPTGEILERLLGAEAALSRGRPLARRRRLSRLRRRPDRSPEGAAEGR